MKINKIILFVIIISVVGCNNKAKRTEKHCEHLNHIHNSGAPRQINQTLAKLPLPELEAINRNLSAQVRENFRSWSYNEPDRWSYLADKFADEIINFCPEASTKKEKIAEVFLTHLNQRADIYNSNAANKQALMGQSATEFKYNLSFLIGIEGYQKWQSFSKNEFQKFNLKRDSLHKVITYSYSKFPKSKITKP